MNIDELDRLLAAATPDKWTVSKEAPGITIRADGGGLPVAEMWIGGTLRPRHNAALIVAAINALPKLIACVRAADAYVDSPNAATQEAYADARAAVGGG